MKKFYWIVISALVLACAAPSFADNRPYGAAGCGWGSQVMGKDGSQVLAATTNASSDTQLFGISSGTSNCTDNGTVASIKAVPAYIEANRQALSTDIARGNGESIVGLSHVMGCNSAGELAGSLQKNYRQIFPSADVSNAAVTQSMMSVIRQDSALSCRHII